MVEHDIAVEWPARRRGLGLNWFSGAVLRMSPRRRYRIASLMEIPARLGQRSTVLAHSTGQDIEGDELTHAQAAEMTILGAEIQDSGHYPRLVDELHVLLAVLPSLSTFEARRYIAASCSSPDGAALRALPPSP